jgi:hypothetical protein
LQKQQENNLNENFDLTSHYRTISNILTLLESPLLRHLSEQSQFFLPQHFARL